MQNIWYKILENFDITCAYDIIRIINPAAKQCCFEHSALDVRTAAYFDYGSHSKYYTDCLESGKTVYCLAESHGELFLYTFFPAALDGTCYVLECCSVVTASFDINILSENHTGMLKTLSRLSHIDDLTNLYNRRFINHKLPLELERCSNEGLSLSLIFADLDFFKEINDRYGHSAGDFLLNEFARQLEQLFKSRCDWIARYGGDEFLLCLTNTAAREAAVLAEELRSSVACTTFYYGETPINITCSFGIYTLEAGSTKLSASELFDAVDRRLYAAKQSGKNQIQ